MMSLDLIDASARIRALVARVFPAALCTLGALVFLFIASARATPVPEDYEAPPEIAATQALPAELASGTDFRVDGTVRSDGLMNHYSVQSRFGTFEVNGRALLQIRIREIGALAELERVSKSEVFLKAVGRSVTAPIETVVDVVQNPIGTVTGIPKGVANLFRSYKLKTREATSSTPREKKADGSASGATGKDSAVTSEAESYAQRYLGVSRAERRWYAKLGVDPYTTNLALRNSVNKVARIDATAGFGLRFAGIPSIAGIGVVRKGMDAIWREDPVVIRERNRKFLSSIAIDKEEISRFENNLSLSPTYQLAILEMTRALDGIGGRGELIHRAVEVASEDETLALVESIGLLVRLHQKTPLIEILGGIRLPAARTTDGRLLVCAGFESVYWTENVAEGARGIEQAYRDAEVSERQIWLAGAGSLRVRAELEKLGWKFFDRIDIVNDLAPQNTQ
jgi:hypothetical protein